MGRRNKQSFIDEHEKVVGRALTTDEQASMTIKDIKDAIADHEIVKETVENVEEGSGVRLHHARQVFPYEIVVTIGDNPYNLPLDEEGNTQSIENAEVVEKLINHPDVSVVDEPAEESETEEPESETEPSEESETEPETDSDSGVE